MWRKGIHPNMKRLFKIITENMTPARIIVSYYVIAVFVSMILLSLPIARKPDASWTFMDALFTAVSSVSVTGLATIDISETFTTTGIFILMFVLQIGGIGIMALGTFFWLVLGRKIGLKERKLIMTDQNQIQLSGLVNLLIQILIIIVSIEIFGALLLGTYFLHYYPTWQEAYFNGLFASISATTNTGFDITGESLKPFAHDYFVQFIHMILIVLGAIGFPVLVEVKNYFLRRKDKDKVHFSLFTKITSFTYFLLVIVGAFFIYIFDFSHFFKNKSWHESLFYSLFHSISSRSAGLVTLDVDQFSEPTLLVLSSLMFIGASPSSVGGGIRTTTFAISLLFIYHFARGNESIKIFKREIYDIDVRKSLVVFLLAVIICFTSSVILSLTENHSFLAIVVEVTSAFGTSGLSLGITSELSNIGKFVLILLMFIGRVGVLVFLFMIVGKEKKDSFHYPKEKIIIG